MPAKKSPKLQVWSLTYQETEANKLPTAEKLISAFEALDCKAYYFQCERAPTTGRLHWQCNIRLKSPMTEPAIRARIKSTCRKDYAGGCLTCTATHSTKAAAFYCLKEETRVEGTKPYAYPDTVYLGADLHDYANMYPWQKSVYDMVIGKKPDDRDITLIVDPMGFNGKSDFVKGLAYHHNARVVPLGLTSAQMKSAIVGEGAHSIYCIDIPRNNKSYVEIFDTIEEIKRGFVISCFHGKLNELFMYRPHIVCFTNECPDLSLLSFDMWKVYTIASSDKTLVPEDKWQIRRMQQQNKPQKIKHSWGSLEGV
jgi:hypothetical protein